MKLSNRLIPLVTLLLLGSVAHSQAASGALSATRATTYTTGQALAATDIAGHDWSCTFTPTGGTAAACAGFTGGSVTGSNPNTTVTFTAPAAGGNACFAVVTRTKAGVSSDPSAVTAASCKAVDPLKPNAPSNVTVTITVALTISSDSPIRVAVTEPVVTKTP